jgi:hypothetical protein
MKPVKSKNLVVISPEKKLIEKDIKAAFSRGLLFLAPLAIMYLTPVIAAISTAVVDGTFMFSLGLFIPNPLVIGAMILYVLNRLTDVISRYIKETTYKA